MGERYKIGQRVDGRTSDGEVPLRVLGHTDDGGVIVEVLADAPDLSYEGETHYDKGEVFVAKTMDLIEREEVDLIPGEPETEESPAIGWMEMGGLSIALTRAGDGALLLSLERKPDYKNPVDVRISRMRDGEDLWEGEIT